MTKDKRQQSRIIITEREDDNEKNRTSQARTLLYRLIAHYRKQSTNADNMATREIFSFATSILEGLAQAFRQHEKQLDDDSVNTKPD